MLKCGSSKAVGKLAALLALTTKYKSELCRAPFPCEFHAKGKCLFHHTRDEVRRDPLGFFLRRGEIYRHELCPRLAANLPCDHGEGCLYAHTQMEQRMHPLCLLRQLKLDGLPENQKLMRTKADESSQNCELAQTHGINIKDDELDDSLIRLKIIGKAKKQRGAVPKSLYLAQGDNVLHISSDLPEASGWGSHV